MAELPQLPPFDFKPEPYSGPSKAEVLEMRNQHLSPALFKYYKNPIMLTDGKMQVRFSHLPVALSPLNPDLFSPKSFS